MNKDILSIVFSAILGALFGVVGTIYAIDWQEESLVYSLSDKAEFGDVVYQNLKIKNEGWNPAENVKIYLKVDYIGDENIQASPNFDVKGSKDSLIGMFDRIRRNEVVTISFSFRGRKIDSSDLTIKSNRSIAEQDSDKGWYDIVQIAIIVWLGLAILTLSFFFGFIVRAKNSQRLESRG